ncbi:MAG: fimbrial protein FimV [Ramlibacter sp.]|nr:fimbrial protein FimV [Ramlibacter sp.]
MKRPLWRASALAIATAVLLGFSASDASALGLGRVTVHSALGEPLRADIDIPEINAEELASLRATVASPDAYRAAGFEYNPAMANITITLQRRPDGSHFLRLTSPRAVNDPFIDLILEASWASGRVVRDYTMLLDPPSLRQSAPAVAAEVPAAAPSARAPSTAAPKATRPSASAAPTARAPAPRQADDAKPAKEDGKQVTVKSGDTAGHIAAANKPTNVSLDQMLIALLRGNPDAFVRGNVNRLKAGAVLEMPSAEQVEQIPAPEARQEIVAQSRDFNDFRRRLAEGLPATSVGGSERQVSGRVQAQVEEKRPAATPDKLTLSKGAVQGKGAADRIARERAAQDNATRIAELNKNISDLNKLGTSTTTGPSAGATAGKAGVALPVGSANAPKSAPEAAAAPASSVKAATPAATAPAPVAAASAAPATAAVAPAALAPAASASAAKPASAPAAAASSPADVTAAATLAADTASPAAAVAASGPAVASAADSAAPSASAPVAAAKPAASKPQLAPLVAETSLVDDLLANPMVPASLGGVLALLVGFGFYRAQQRKKSTQVDSSFLESRLQPDSFFGASGGQRIDTNESSATGGSSMVYSPSQLDAAGDVDPVAEADVYLAYGRDLQAEEILKEAMRTAPQRVAIHSKLLEIYAKRRDTKAFEQVASEAHALTRAEGPEWDHICELGRDLDASNPLYRPGGQPARMAPRAADSGGPAGLAPAAAQTPAIAAAAAAPVDLDLDLDFSIGEAPTAKPAKASLSTTQPIPAQVAEPMPALDLNFGANPVAAAPPAAPVPAPASPNKAVSFEAPKLDGPGNELNLTQPIKALASAAPAPAAESGMIEFDLGDLSLDLGTPPAPAATPPARAAAEPLQEAFDSTAGGSLDAGGTQGDGDDPLATKLALAQEFNAIGDPDGARSLAQEVLAEASGDLKQKAQRFLAEIA